MGYYWPTMVCDCIDFARRCDACQLHANFIHQPPEPLHPTVVSWPFWAWRLDVVGSFIDYFSKWLEAIALKEVTKDNMVDFI